MSFETVNRQVQEFVQVLQASQNPDKIYSIIVHNILQDECIDDFLKTQQICYLMSAFEMVKKAA